MAEQAKIGPMNMSGDLWKNWKEWRKEFEEYLNGTQMKNQPEAITCAQLLIFMGSEGVKIYRTFKFEPDQANKLDVLLTKFTDHFTPKVNLTYQRHKFITFKQKPNDTFEKFLKLLKTEALLCDWGELHDDLLKLAIINGVSDLDLRKTLLNDPDKSLEEVVDFCICTQEIKKVYANKQESKLMPNNIRKDMINSCKFCGNSHERGHCPAYGQTCNICLQINHLPNMCEYKQQLNFAGTDLVVDCHYCGFTHAKRNCPAYGQMCDICQQMNHFPNMCKKEQKPNNNPVSELVTDCHYCGMTHEKRSCPAYGQICGICQQPNHFSRSCRNQMANQGTANRNVRVVLINDCRFCGQTHERRNCPAYGKTCDSCNQLNHFARVCTNKQEEQNCNIS